MKIFFVGPFSLTAKMVCLEGSMDALVLIDALAIIMGHEEKELCKPGQAALALILQTATNVLGSKDRVSENHQKCCYNLLLGAKPSSIGQTITIVRL